jgi:hypothetical protein
MSETTRVSEAVARPARTAIQMAPAAVFTEVIDVFIVDMDERGYAAIFALLTLLFGWFQTWRENSTGQGWWFRKVPPTDQPVAGA